MKDTKFMSAQEKEKVLRQWELFLKSGLKWEKFNKALYNHLIQHCSFIAHYGRCGFYTTYFEAGDDIAKFLSQFDQRNTSTNGIPPSVEYGGTWWVGDDYGDINLAMIDVAGKYIPSLLKKAKSGQEATDVAEAMALLKKHNIKVKIE